MKLTQFRNLRPAMQLRVALALGTYLVHRLEEEEEIYLYHLADTGKGFFAEITYTENQDELMVLRSFAGAAPLAKYTPYMPLPEF